MKTRRSFVISSLCAAAASGAAAPSGKRFDWKVDAPIPADVSTRRPRLWPEAAEWKRRAAAIPAKVWRPMEKEKYEAPPAREEGNSGAPGYVLMDLTASWLATGHEFYAETAKRTLKRVCTYPIWGGNGKPKDTDLHAGALLMGGGIAYDVFRDQLSASDRQFILDKYVKQAGVMYAFHAAKPAAGWEQNHTYIDRGGLWCTSVALHGEAPEAAKWYALGSRALRNAAYLLNEPDGAFYENLGYWGFGFAQHGLPLLDMFRRVTGENVFADFGALRKQKYYLMHSLLPGGKYFINIGDGGEDKIMRASLGRARYPMLKYGSEYHDAEAQWVAGYFGRAQDLKPAHDPWTLLFWDGEVGEKDPRQSWSTMHHFDDQDLVTARSSWSDDATHFALRCGPAVGHRMTKIHLSGELKGWKPGTGHVHPDLNAFMIFDHGEHLALDTGYTWTKLTREHSTVAVDGGGQVGDGERWPNYDPLDKFGKIGRFVDSSGEYMYMKGESAPGYDAELKLTRFDRHASMMCDTENTWFLVHDLLESGAPHKYEWLLIAASKAVEAGAQKYRIVSGKRAMTVNFLSPVSARFSQEVVKVEPRPKGTVERGQRLSFAVDEKHSCEFLVALTLHGREDAGPVVEQKDGVVSVAGGGWQDLFAVKPAGMLASDGHHAMVRVQGSGVARWAVNDATVLSFRGKELMRASAPVSIAAGAKSATVVSSGPAELTIGRVRVKVGAGRQEVRFV